MKKIAQKAVGAGSLESASDREEKNRTYFSSP